MGVGLAHPLEVSWHVRTPYSHSPPLSRRALSTLFAALAHVSPTSPATPLPPQMEIANLTRLVEQGSGLAMGEESTLNDLLKQKEDLIRERDQQVDQIMALRAELMETQEKLRHSENEKLTLDTDIQGLKDGIAEKKMEAEREQRKKDRMEKEMKELRTNLENRQQEIKQRQLQITSTEEQVARLEQLVRESKLGTEKVQKEYNQLNEKVQKLHHDLEEQIHTNTQLLAENSQKQVELKVKEDEIAQIKAEAMRVNKLREQVRRVGRAAGREGTRLGEHEAGRAQAGRGEYGWGLGVERVGHMHRIHLVTLLLAHPPLLTLPLSRSPPLKREHRPPRRSSSLRTGAPRSRASATACATRSARWSTSWRARQRRWSRRRRCVLGGGRGRGEEAVAARVGGGKRFNGEKAADLFIKQPTAWP
jgi:hypothetical protein